MRAPASFLHRTAAAIATDEASSSPAPPSPMEQRRQGQPTAPAGMAVDSNMVVILASLLCAIVCVLGLALVSRCACRWRRSSSSSPYQSPPPPKGLRKKVIQALPTVSFTAAAPPSSSSPAPTAWPSSSECAICLAEFAEGEAVRVLPRCGHGFHVACVDAWLRTHATCPSCRANIVAEEPLKPAGPTVVVVVAGGCSRCSRCGEGAAPGACAGDATPVFMP
uniref:Uncharacterized protein n=1 Tax=Avena sativa TaxID=4498 RepID=A0ACD5ZDF9_AVESA